MAATYVPPVQQFYMRISFMLVFNRWSKFSQPIQFGSFRSLQLKSITIPWINKTNSSTIGLYPFWKAILSFAFLTLSPILIWLLNGNVLKVISSDIQILLWQSHAFQSWKSTFDKQSFLSASLFYLLFSLYSVLLAADLFECTTKKLPRSLLLWYWVSIAFESLSSDCWMKYQHWLHLWKICLRMLLYHIQLHHKIFNTGSK